MHIDVQLSFPEAQLAESIDEVTQAVLSQNEAGAVKIVGNAIAQADAPRPS